MLQIEIYFGELELNEQRELLVSWMESPLLEHWTIGGLLPPTPDGLD